jgi:hypothetical protein
LGHLGRVKYTKRRRKEVMPVFERPYLKKTPSRHDVAGNIWNERLEKGIMTMSFSI